METNPTDDLDLIESEAEPLNVADVEDPDLFLDLEDDDGYGSEDDDF
jgi:hypothetical protein